ncbi:FlaG/FlaF family flagellin (archaellin) [Methanomicrobium sp. W14]|uniref:type IV pilin N-terminal domain-containing protein n=1 Tax=Methanomicrobium sp. W14 TaxID=2817839 RepID=UPI001AE68B2E|nr:type IV pilin N-terminal domain-containing protein [Methanomicrobium sp. W14]MBP2133181.1 FlaG/FlaF family flagellin (archaellin) [Methanomicrobium sp. W14]
MKINATEAVSPVVGVMLMLVVTIIIASVVSAFAGGLAGSQEKTPQTTLGVEEVIEGFSPSNTDPGQFSNGLKFENTGGDTFSLNDIKIRLQSSDTKYTLTTTDKVNWSDTSVCLPEGITYNDGYFQKIGNTSTTDVTIAPGDKFMLYADSSLVSQDYSSLGYGIYPPKISWRPIGVKAGFGAYMNSKLEYQVIDKDSGRVISSGELYLTE